MTVPHAPSGRRRIARVLIPLAVALSFGLASTALPSAAADNPPRLGIGDPGLPETRTTTQVAPGITHTKIRRGLPLDDPAEIPTTTSGPWVVNVLTIDPRVAKGNLAVTDGPTLADSETVTDLASYSGALAAINASFFTYTGDREYPGNAGGLTIRAGRIISEPNTSQPREVDLIFDAKSNRMKISHTTWRSEIVMDAGASIDIERLNHRPKVPATCTDLVDQTTCPADGDTFRFHSDFAAATPSGHGVEVVLNAQNCVVSVHDSRGRALQSGQTSVQATGSDAVALSALGDAGGCGTVKERLLDDQGRQIPLTAHTWASTGRVELLADGRSVVPDVDSLPDRDKGFFGRHPRTFGGQTADGRWVFVTVDGRSTTSVGSTMDESAQIAADLGLVDAINLDGGGSTTMVVDGRLVNLGGVSSAQRKVGEALVWLPAS